MIINLQSDLEKDRFLREKRVQIRGPLNYTHQIGSRVKSARGIMRPLPAMPSNTVARDRPLTDSGLVKLLTCGKQGLAALTAELRRLDSE